MKANGDTSASIDRPSTAGRVRAVLLQSITLSITVGCTLAQPARTTIVVVMPAPTPPVAAAVAPAGPTAIAPTPPAATRPPLIRWGTSWYAGQVLAPVCGTWSRVRFDGYGAEWESIVGADDLRDATAAPRPTSPGQETDRATDTPRGSVQRGSPERAAVVDPDQAAPVDPQATLATGSRVYARSGEGWYEARVVREECANLVRVSYVGWDAAWDETVPRERLRIAGPARATGATTPRRP